MPVRLFFRIACRYAGVLLLLAVAACATAPTPLQQLEKAQLKDNGGFFSGLATEYLAFARSETELGRSRTSDHFARKGLAASKHNAVPPESPADWNVTGDNARELENSRARLMRIRSEFMEKVAAQNMARTQLLYDCWVMQASEGTQNDAALPCKNEFAEELRGLEEIVGEAAKKPAPVTLPATFTILFEKGSVDLDKNAIYTLGEVVKATRQFPAHTIDIVGHTDRAGRDDYNVVLATNRAANVASALAEAGIDPERIALTSVGENKPASPTLDGTPRDRNRRVEIRVQQQVPLPQSEMEPVEEEIEIPVS